MRSRCSSNDDARSRATDARTLVSRSVNAPKRTLAFGRGARGSLDPQRERVLVEPVHAALGVLHHHHLAGAERVLRDRQRAHDVVGDETAGVAQHVRVAGHEAERERGIDAGVHARDQHHGPHRMGLEVAVLERGDEAVVVLRGARRSHSCPASLASAESHP